MTYKYTAKPLVSQGGFTRGQWEINFKCIAYPGEDGGVEDVQVYSHRRAYHVDPSTRLYNAMAAQGCFDRALECAGEVWAGEAQDYYDGLGEYLRDRKMDSFGDMFIAAHKGMPRAHPCRAIVAKGSLK